MNWFQKLWANPVVHVVLTVGSSVAGVVFPQYQVAAAALAGAFGLNAAHAATTLTVAPPSVTSWAPPATGSLHALDYAGIIAALVQGMKDAGLVKTADPPKP